MSILINDSTKLCVQGITGSHGKFHTSKMLEYGTKIVAGVTPGKGGTDCLGVPVFNTVREAKEAGANASVIFVPALYAADSIFEAVDAGIELIVCITEGIPVTDMMRVKHYLNGKNSLLLGPNCPGLITPGECKIGILPAMIHKKGHIGVVSRSGTLTYEAVNQLSVRGIGQSSAVGIGGDPIKGLGFKDVLKMFNDDKDTLGVVMIGEIGGSGEEDAAEWIKHNMRKPVAAFIGGSTAPAGKRMGHAGAIIMGGKGTAAGKQKALTDAGVHMALTPDVIGETLIEAIKKAGVYEKCLTVK